MSKLKPFHLICCVKITAASNILGTVSITSGIMRSDVAACVFIFQKACPHSPVSFGGADWTPNNMLCLSMNMQLHYLAHHPLIINTETVTCIFNTNSIFTHLITTKILCNLQLLRKLYIINNKSINFCLVSFMFLKYALSVKFACMCGCVCAHQSMSIQSQQCQCSIYFMYKFVFHFLDYIPFYSVIFILYCTVFSLLSLIVSISYVLVGHKLAMEVNHHNPTLAS